MKCLPEDRSPPSMGKPRRKKEEICELDVWWLGYQHPWIFTDCLEHPLSRYHQQLLPLSFLVVLVLPHRSHTTTHPLRELPGVRAPTASILLQRLLCQRTRATSVLEAGPAVGQVFWEVEGEKKIGILVVVLGGHPK